MARLVPILRKFRGGSVRTTFLGVKVPDIPKAIRCKVGDLVYATWYDYNDQEPIGGIGIVVELVFHSTQSTSYGAKRIKILYDGRHQNVSPNQVYDPKEGKAYFEPKPSF